MAVDDRSLADHGLRSERVLWQGKGPGVFEQEVAELEQRVGLTTLAKAVAWSQTKSMWPDTFGLACCAIEMMSIVSSRYDIARFGMEAFRASPRQADLLIVSGRVVHKMAAPLRQIYDQMLEPKWVIAMGACASLRRHVQQLHHPPGRGQDRPRRHPRARLPAPAGGADGGHRPPAREGHGRRSARLRDPRSGPSELCGRARPGRGEGGVRGDDARRRSGAARRGVHRSCGTSTASTSSRTCPRSTTSTGARSRSPATGAARRGAT